MLHMKFNFVGFEEKRLKECGRHTTTLIGQVVSAEKRLKEYGQRTTTTTYLSYKLTKWAFWSGELKIHQLLRDFDYTESWSEHKIDRPDAYACCVVIKLGKTHQHLVVVMWPCNMPRLAAVLICQLDHKHLRVTREMLFHLPDRRFLKNSSWLQDINIISSPHLSMLPQCGDFQKWAGVATWHSAIFLALSVPRH